MLPLRDQILIEFRKHVSSEIYSEWLNTPNIELRTMTPNEAIAKGDLNHDYTILWSLISKLENPTKFLQIG